MCGIIGYVGNNGKIKDLINGLKTLEYRGYDSSGVAYINKNKLSVERAVGKINELSTDLNLEKPISLGIGHTRWATSGAPTINNAHPHTQGNITLVHNGIIENDLELKHELEKNGYTFLSETDTEVAAAYLDWLYSQNKDIIKTLNAATKIFKGSYAFGIILKDDPNHLYAIRKESPLIVAVGVGENLIASDVPAIVDKTKDYILLDNFEIAKISDNKIEIYDHSMNVIKKEVLTFDGDIESVTKAGYEHYMLKEINEIPKTLKDTVNMYNQLDYQFDISKYSEIDIVACGSAYHAGLVGKYIIEKYLDIRVNCFIASEYRYQKNWFSKKKLVIIISQSGETADSLAALELANQHVDTLAIVNVYNSSIARNAKHVIYTKVGHEISVATTKAYCAQIAVLILLTKLSVDWNQLYKTLEDIIKYHKYHEIAQSIKDSDHLFFLGRGIDYSLALEGSLKLKEISYIHSETYAAGELKHGTISLIEPNTPIIGVITDNAIADKTISNIKEVKARGAYVIIITNEEDKVDEVYDEIIVIPSLSDIINPLVTIIPLQLIAYYTAKLRGCDIDQPRNLAKSVTVE